MWQSSETLGETDTAIEAGEQHTIAQPFLGDRDHRGLADGVRFEEP